MKITKQQLERIIENKINKVLNEAFKSSVIAKFFGYLKDAFKERYNSKFQLPSSMKTLKWSDIPDNIVIYKPANEVGKYVNDDNYIIFWINSKKKIVKWNPPTYTKYGGRKIDKTIYLYPGLVGVSSARVFQEPSKSKVFKDIENNYDKPDAIKSVKAMQEFSDHALILPKKELQKYSASELQTQRQESKRGALALQSAEDILFQNKLRYLKILKNNRKSSEIKKYDDIVKTYLKKYIDIIKKLSTNIDTIENINKLSDIINKIKPLYDYLLKYFDEVVNSINQGYTIKYGETYFNDIAKKLDRIFNEIENLE